MDLSKLSDQDLLALKSGDLTKVSDEGMQVLSGKPAPTMMDKVKGAAGTALEYGGKALDYGSGLSRTAAANVLEPFTENNVVSSDDVMNAIKGMAPQSSEYLARAGVEKGGSLSDVVPEMYSATGNEWTKFQKGGALDPTARGTAGFVLDTALDPLTYASFGAVPAMKAGGKAARMGAKALAPLESLAESTGTSMYKSGLKRIDQEAAKFGKEPVSDVLMKNDIAGSAGSIYNQMDALSGRLADKQQSMLGAATKAGGEVSMDKSMEIARAQIAELRASRDPIRVAAADALEKEMGVYTKLDPSLEMVDTGRIQTMPGQPIEVPTGRSNADYLGTPEMAPATSIDYAPVLEGRMTPAINPEQASKMKTSLYESLPKGTFQEMVAAAQGANPAVTAGKKQMARGLKEQTEASVGRALGEGAQKEFQMTNDELSRLLTTQDKQQMEAFKEANKNLITSVDAPMMALMAEGKISPAVWLAKKAADVAKMTGPRTLTGRELVRFGQRGKSRYKLLTPASDVALRRNLLDNKED